MNPEETPQIGDPGRQARDKILRGPIPGPGGIFFAAPGLALVLKTSLWAKRRYVHFKRWQPRAR